MCHRGTCIRYGHSGPEARLGGRMPLRPGVSPPRVSPWAMVHRAYSPAGYVPFGPTGPFGGRMQYAPTVVRAFGSLRVPGQIRRPPQGPAPTRVHAFGSLRVPGQLPCPGRGRAFLRSDRNKCTSSSCFCLRILVRLRGQRSIRKTCVSIRNITYFISPVHMAGMFILQAPYLLPISAVCFPRCSRNPRAVNNPSRRN